MKAINPLSGKTCSYYQHKN